MTLYIAMLGIGNHNTCAWVAIEIQNVRCRIAAFHVSWRELGAPQLWHNAPL